MVTKYTLQKLYYEMSQVFLLNHDDVSCQRTVDYYPSRKVMRLIITADDVVKFNLIIEMSLQDEVIDWTFDKSIQPADAIFYESQLRKDYSMPMFGEVQ